MNENIREAVQRDLRYTSQQILNALRNEQSPLQHHLVVNSRTENIRFGVQLIEYIVMVQ